MKLKQLFKDVKDLTFKGSKDLKISGITSDSRLVAPGNLFIAKRGAHFDGTEYIPQAISNGAIAILTDIFNPFHTGVTQIIHPNLQSIEAQLANSYYNNPSKDLLMVGITGTNGKTTSAYLTKHLLDNLQKPCGLISSIDNIIGYHQYQATHTTPDIITNQRLLREMINNKCTSGVMEVSSHGLHQQRTKGIDYDVAIFTNLTHEHLDYHGTLEEYAAAKARLFKDLNPSASAIVNVDDPYHHQMLAQCKAKVLTYGINTPADIIASDIQCSLEKTSFKVSYQGDYALFSTSLIGRHNIYNCLPVIALGTLLGYDLTTISKIIATFLPVPGRLEKVSNSLGLNIYIDYAVTEDALENIFSHLHPLAIGKIITVFGCGGERDKAKRPLMAKVAEKYSDLTIVTNDNPRKEDPQDIAQQIVKGFINPQKFIIELDRRQAIKKAITQASPQDLILIAGKGHENYQILADKIIDFNDSLVATEICQQLKLAEV
ncbi:MAG: UDP-N-acetylmuramoyl-L-alanyl-D-glutamate--2,6-diaminopimelate ligase [Chlamydiota bacterium]